MTDAELGRAVVAALQKSGAVVAYMPGTTDADYGRAARALLAKPVATRESVERWLTTRDQCVPSSATVRCHLDALSHFARPASNAPILRMSVEEIACKVQDTFSNGIPSNSQLTIAEHVAHAIWRLAQPVPEVDPDAQAKRLAQSQGIDWLTTSDEVRNACRKLVVAAAEKTNADK